MRTILLASLLLIAYSALFSQEIISPAGNYSANSDITISYTIGEPIIETLQSGDFQITQGFHQTKLIVSGISTNSICNDNVKVYPNPTNEYLYIDFNAKDEILVCFLTDENGKKLTTPSSINSIISIDMRHFPPGVYFIYLTNSKNQIATYKIVKQ